jgi:MerR family transcriptional regulator, light-induced transcriptional regulator
MPVDPKLVTFEMSHQGASERGLAVLSQQAVMSEPRAAPVWRDEAAADRRHASFVAQALQDAVCDMVLPALLSNRRAPHSPPSVHSAHHPHAPRSLRAAHHHAHAAPASGWHLSADDIAAFAGLLIEAEDATLDAVLAFWRHQGLSLESLLADGLHGASQLLGLWWEQDQCDFATVTACTARLQRLMQFSVTSLYAERADRAGAALTPTRRPRIWLGAAPGEQHRFGLAMAAELFRLAGWEVVGLREPQPIVAIRDVNAALLRYGSQGESGSENGVDAVGFSVGSEKEQTWTRCVVDNLRSHAKLTHHLVLLGGPLAALRPDEASSWGVDLLCPRGELAPLAAERRLFGAHKPMEPA